MLCVKRTLDWGYLSLPAGWRPLLPLLVYFCSLEANVFICGQENSRQLECQGKTSSICYPLMSCCLLYHQAGKIDITSFCAIMKILLLPRALCRFQFFRELRWEPPNLPSDPDPSSNIELQGPYWRLPHCLAQNNWGCLPSRNSEPPPLVTYQVSCKDKDREDFLVLWGSLKQWSSQHQLQKMFFQPTHLGKLFTEPSLEDTRNDHQHRKVSEKSCCTVTCLGLFNPVFPKHIWCRNWFFPKKHL